MLEFLQTLMSALNVGIALVSAVLLAVVAILTGSYVRSAWALVRETRSQHQPQVWLTVGPQDKEIDVIDFEVRNTGPEGAYDIAFFIHATPPNVVSALMAKSSMVEHGISYLGPGQAIRTFLVQTNTIADTLDALRFSVTINFRDQRGAGLSCESRVDLRAIHGIRRVRPQDPLEQLSRSHKDLVTAVKGLKT